MTTCMERYRAALHTQAVTLISLIASPLFKASMQLPDGTPENERLFETWYRVKELAASIDRDQSLAMHPDERAELFAAADLAHLQGHPLGTECAASACSCAVARYVNALTAVFEAHDAQEAKGSAAA
jgi:hypothetical protein